MKTYKLNLPENYVKPPLPMRDIWIADLRNPPPNVRQGSCSLRTSHENTFADCCLGRLACLQGRLVKSNNDLWYDSSCLTNLSHTNPLFVYLGACGELPSPVTVNIIDKDGDESSALKWLTELNDGGLTFAQIADIIEQVWENQPAQT